MKDTFSAPLEINPFRKPASAPNLPHCQNQKGSFRRKAGSHLLFLLWFICKSLFATSSDYRVNKKKQNRKTNLKLCSEDFSYKRLRTEYKNSLRCGPERKVTISHLIVIDKDSFFNEFIAWKTILKKEEDIREIRGDVNHILVIEPVFSHHQQLSTEPRLNAERVF